MSKSDIRNGDRKKKHNERVKALRERKRTRRHRGEIHRAIEEARRLKRSKKKGCADIEKNMLGLGWQKVSDTGPIEERFVRVVKEVAA